MIKIIHFILVQIIFTLAKIICLLVAIAYYTIAERKIMAAVQRRRGPNVVGFWGLLQPVADGLKLVAKEMVIPSHSSGRIFVLAPMVILTLSLSVWNIIPFNCVDAIEYAQTSVKPPTHLLFSDFSKGNESGLPRLAGFDFSVELNDIADVRYGVLVALAFSSLSVYGIIISGWASNSKYAFLGALRSAAQMISYEVSISLTILPVVILSGSFNLTEIVMMQDLTIWYIVPLLPAAIIFFVSMIAETNRTPFDLPEAEAELVAGYNVEYSSITFAMFFLAEYGNMILMSLIQVLFFWGGWCGVSFLPPVLTMVLKGLVFCFLFVLIRATLPRYRYDQLMDIGWKLFLPLATGFLIWCVCLLFITSTFPLVDEIGLLELDEALSAWNGNIEQQTPEALMEFVLKYRQTLLPGGGSGTMLK